MFSSPFDEPPFERELVSEIELVLEDRSRLLIGPHVDYCSVAYRDSDGQPITIPFSELRLALLNWEDLHNDETIGFQASSPALFLGKKGEKYVGNPYITLKSSGEESPSLFIGADDFFLLACCIAYETKQHFDEYSEYTLPGSSWRSVLQLARSLLELTSFDDLFDTVLDWNIKCRDGSNYMLNVLNVSGAVFWKNRERYREQINDLFRWTAIAVKDEDNLKIEGC